MRVPRVTEQQVRITPLSNARQRLRVSADTFGAQRAQRLSQTAEGVADLGDSLGRIALDRVSRERQARDAAERQALQTEADAERGVACWQSAATDTLAGFQSLQGMDAVGTYHGALAQLAGLETRIGEEIGDEVTKALFAQQVTRRLPDFQASLARHYEAQLRAYRATAAETRIQSAVDAALTSPDLMPGALAEIAAVSAQQGETLDLPTEDLPDAVAGKVRGHTSKIHVGLLERLLSQGRGAEALAHLERHRGQMTEADRARFEVKATAAARRSQVLAGYRAIATGGELPAELRAGSERPGEAAGLDDRPAGDDGGIADPGKAQEEAAESSASTELSSVADAGAVPLASAASASPHGLSPRVLLARDGATVQAEALAGSPQAALHEDYLAQLDRLAAAGIADPEVHGQIADMMTADYERQTAALQAAKATALEETYRGLRTGETTPATLPPDLAEALSEVERAETQAWWREGLAVEPDAALFEALSALPPQALLALNLAEPRFARHLSEDETARLRSLQAELRRQRGLIPAEDPEAAPPVVPLTELNTTLEELRDSVGGGHVPGHALRRQQNALRRQQDVLRRRRNALRWQAGLSYLERARDQAGPAIEGGFIEIVFTLAGNLALQRLHHRDMSWRDLYEDHRIVTGIIPIDLGAAALATRDYTWATIAELLGEDSLAEAEKYFTRAVEGRRQRQSASMTQEAMNWIDGVRDVIEKSGDWENPGASVSAALEFTLSNPGGAIAFGFESLLRSSPEIVAVAAVSIATGQPIAGILVGAGLTYLEEQTQRQNDALERLGIDMSDPESLRRALSDREMMEAVEAVGAKEAAILALVDLASGSFGKLRVSPKHQTYKEVADFAIDASVGGVGETLIAFSRGDTPDLTTVFVELAGGSAGAAAGVLWGTLRDVRRSPIARKIAADQDLLARLNGAATASKAAGPSADARQDIIVQALEASDVPASLYVTAQGFIDYFNSKNLDPFAQAELLRKDGAALLEDALATDGVLEVPTTAYVTRIGGTEHFDGIARITRSDARGVTAADADRHLAKLVSEIQENLPQVEANFDRATANRDLELLVETELSRVREVIELSPSREKEIQAVLIDGLTGIAARSNIDPRALWLHHRGTITAELGKATQG